MKWLKWATSLYDVPLDETMDDWVVEGSSFAQLSESFFKEKFPVVSGNRLCSKKPTFSIIPLKFLTGWRFSVFTIRNLEKQCNLSSGIYSYFKIHSIHDLIYPIHRFRRGKNLYQVRILGTLNHLILHLRFHYQKV